MLSSCLLFDVGYPFLKMSKTGIVRNGLEVSVNFVFAHNVKAPFDKMIFEDPLVQLVDHKYVSVQ
jgi:hypothetical protein